MLSGRVPDLSAMQLLSAVDRTGSLSAAAQEMGYSQQAASSRMRSLESQLGAELVHRSPTGSQLTQTGRLVAGWAQDVLSAAERMDFGLAALRERRATRMRIAASLTTSAHLVPTWLVELHRQQLRVGAKPTDVELITGNSSKVVDLVRNDKAAIGFIETPELPRDLKCRVIAEDELVLVVAPGHPWARRRGGVSLEQVAKTPLVTREPGSGTRRALELILAKALPDAEIAEPAVELSTEGAVNAAIGGGLAPGVLSRLSVADELALGRLRSVKIRDHDLTRPLAAIWRTGRYPTQGPGRDLVAIAAA
ncbi:LysR family transcriptional regulator [Microlunatus soli]|uniref:ModE molybdate transport repressor domain-containing protein n=1 Tax=Microlunatus soli TaxID=630515 RepID=A0A1H1TAY6_9ACTN|nr:LysR family transcriptional regulator [Microlunatus soli]SDS57156.1 ModE molybdate transport repressor domain-containing protein [Microlunatus soli]